MHANERGEILREAFTSDVSGAEVPDELSLRVNDGHGVNLLLSDNTEGVYDRVRYLHGSNIPNYMDNKARKISQ